MREQAAMLRTAIPVALLLTATFPSAQQTPTRDAPAQEGESSLPARGEISGRVLASDTGRPVSRARVLARAPELPGGRGTLTDENGRFDLTGLPAGRYALTVAKTGFVNLSYGQRRPLLSGTPLQLLEAQRLTGIEFRLPRGSVVAGHVFDETGEALPGTIVRVLRYEYSQGGRQLVPAGTGETDDRGQYRVWGLNPGEHYVSAVARIPRISVRSPGAGLVGRGLLVPPRRGGRGFIVDAGDPSALREPEEPAYAPTYYPGVNELAQARSIALGLSAEVLNVDFTLRLVPTSRVSGRVVAGDNGGFWRARVVLMADVPAGRGARGPTYGSRTLDDGLFTLRNVPPGRYVLRALAEGETPLYAEQPVIVDGSDVNDLTVVLSHGATLTGTVRFDSTQSAAPDSRQVRISTPSFDIDSFEPGPTARPQDDGTFSLEGVRPATRWIRALAPRGWILKSVLVAGRDRVDDPLEFQSGQSIQGVELVFSDRPARITGVVTDARGAPMGDYTVLAFPTDPNLWRPHARQIATARPDQNGTFEVDGLPAGDYFVTIIDPAEPGEWLDPGYLDQHRVGAERVALAEGDTTTQDFKISTP